MGLDKSACVNRSQEVLPNRNVAYRRHKLQGSFIRASRPRRLKASTIPTFGAK